MKVLQSLFSPSLRDVIPTGASKLSTVHTPPFLSRKKNPTPAVNLMLSFRTSKQNCLDKHSSVVKLKVDTILKTLNRIFGPCRFIQMSLYLSGWIISTSMPSVGVTPTYTAGKYASLLGKCETSSTSFSNHLQTIHLTKLWDHCGGWRIYSVNVKQDAPNQDFNLKKTENMKHGHWDALINQLWSTALLCVCM